MPPWNRVLVTHDLWPDELVDDITGSFDDLRDQWPLNGGSVESTLHLLPPVCPYCNT